jgi:hypothetical protein
VNSQCKTIILFYKVHFKPVAACNTEIWTLTKRNRRKSKQCALHFLDILGGHCEQVINNNIYKPAGERKPEGGGFRGSGVLLNAKNNQ